MRGLLALIYSLEKPLLPAAEAFRQYILTQGQDSLARGFWALLVGETRESISKRLEKTSSYPVNKKNLLLST